MQATAKHSTTPGLRHAVAGHAPRRQRGAVLIVGLVMLTVMTLLVVSMIKTSIVDLKIGGVSQDAMINFNNAEIGLMTYFNNNNGKFSNNCLTLAAGVNCSNFTAPVVSGGNNPGLTASQIYCGDKPGFTGNQVGLAYQTVVFDVISEATSAINNTWMVRLHAGIAQDLPPGACSAV
jgi:Tfp pilus assembly protein PilX